MYKFIVPIPTLSDTDRRLLAAGMFPNWWRVWSNGVDVTDQPVTRWPDHAQLAYEGGWRPVINLDGDFMD